MHIYSRSPQELCRRSVMPQNQGSEFRLYCRATARAHATLRAGNCELSDVLSGREYSSEVASANLQCDLTGVL